MLIQNNLFDVFRRLAGKKDDITQIYEIRALVVKISTNVLLLAFLWVLYNSTSYVSYYP